jgi:hypothetical protein
MHGHAHVTPPAGRRPPAAAAGAPSRRPADDPQNAERVPMDFFVDPASGWTCWIPRPPVQAPPRAGGGPWAAARGPRGRRRVIRLLGRVGVWFGSCEPTPSGSWRRVHVPRRDPWEPGARHHHSTIWSWWW